MNKNGFKSKYKINKIGVTNDTLTGRGGMALFVRYLSNVEIYPLLQRLFGNIRKNNKGLPVWNIYKQMFCWFYDGTSRHLNHFDQLKGDEGYASVIENSQEAKWSTANIQESKRLSTFTSNLEREDSRCGLSWWQETQQLW